MKSPLVITAIAIIIAVIAVFALTQNKNSQKVSSMTGKETEVMEKSTDDSMQKEGKMEDAMMEKGEGSRYVPYTKSALDGAAQNRRVLFFYANWCPTCRPADANFTQNSSKIPEDVTLIRVNYNDTDTDQEEKDLAKKYGVTYQHTYVQIDQNGQEVTKWNGGQIQELLANIK